MTLRGWLFLLLLAPGGWAQTLNDFMDESVMHEIRITINPTDWKRLQENFEDNTYYPAIFKWRDMTVEDVGIRSKGRTSRRPNKPGLRVDFNRYTDNQEFLGLKSILIDNNIQDLTFMKERLAMRVFEMMGLPATKETHTRLFVNNEYIGVYSIVESTDKRFLQTRYGEDNGYLYEYVTTGGYRFQYLGSDPGLYSPIPFKPQTHEVDPEPKPIEAMIRTLNQASDANFVSAMSEYLDLKRFLTHLAVEAYLAEFDGILSDDGMANFYFYRFQGKNLGTFIPKDKDITFILWDYPMLKNIQANVLTRRCMAVPELKEHFVREILRVAKLVEGEGGWLQREADKIYALIKEDAYADKNKECVEPATCTPDQATKDFDRSVQYLKQFAVERTPLVLKELTAAGYPIPSLDTPQIVQGAAVNAVPNGGGTVSPGALATLYGSNLAHSAILQDTAPWPATVAGGQVFLNGVATPIYYASPTQINFQVPWETAAGTATVQAALDGTRSGTITVNVAAASPGVFNITHADYQVVTAGNPATPGETLILWANGLGNVSNRPATGAPALISPLSYAAEAPVVRIGGTASTVLSAVLAPGYVGLYQVNVVVPSVPVNPAVPVTILVGGQTSPTFNIALR